MELVIETRCSSAKKEQFQCRNVILYQFLPFDDLPDRVALDVLGEEVALLDGLPEDRQSGLVPQHVLDPDLSLPLLTELWPVPKEGRELVHEISRLKSSIRITLYNLHINLLGHPFLPHFPHCCQQEVPNNEESC